MALCVRTPLVTAQKVSYEPDGVLKTPVVGIAGSSRRFVASHEQKLTKRSYTALNAYHPVKPLPTRRTPSRRSEVDGEQHMTLTTQPPRNKREVAEGVWAYIMLGGLLFSGMIFVLPEFSMAIPLIFKAFGGQ